ncbi:MAG: nucleotidyltransferase family protein [Planctomycetaceae bacterium]|nr:nucleotidyltransferase family protein [Planctomycetaceae bacterium]
MRDPTGFLISPIASIRDAMARIDAGTKGIVLVVDDEQRLISTVTDGDIRRAILADLSLDAPVTQLIDRKPPERRRSTTMPAGTSDDELLAVMQAQNIRHLPVVDDDGCVVELALREDLEPRAEMPVAAVIMAGGFGTRLRPLTDNIPKPMLSIGGTPLLERTVDRLRKCGIKTVNFTTHYLPEVIEDHFGDGSDFGVHINYVAEDRPLGTAGALSLLPDSDEPLLVMNGDILTSIDFQELLRFHRDRNAAMTVCVRQYEFTVPYGVIQAEQGMVRGLREKPKLDFLVNAGIYLLEPSVRNYIPSGRRFDMTDLIDQLLEHGLRVASFPVVEYWLDIGQIEDFHRAQEDVQTRRWAA